MGYEPYLIADFKTGLEKDKQPWLIPDDAQESLFDGYVHHGVISKREGYNFYANGLNGGAPYCESRIVSRVSDAAMTGAIDNANTTYTITASNPVRRGTFTVTGTTPAQSVTDNGAGAFTGDGTGTINYVTGAVSITFNTAPTGGTVTATYDYYPLLPVMMIANFISETNTNVLLVADTQNLNRYNSTTNRLDDITVTAFTGSSSDFFSWTQYPTPEDDKRLIFTNNVDQIQYYNGTTSGNWYPVYTSSTATTDNDSGDGTAGPYTPTVSSPPIMPGTLSIVAAGSQTVTDDGNGNLQGDGTGTVNYGTGAISVTFNAVVAMGANNITIDYETATGFVITAQHVVNYQDRLVLFRTTETGGTIYPQRIRHSGVGENGDDFRSGTTVGAGIIDIPTAYWISGIEFNRDDILVYTEKETWILKFSNNDAEPFFLEKIDGSRGNKAPFAPISYLNFTKAYSPNGFTISDGYQVQRYDQRIPDFSFDEIDQNNFNLLFSGAVDDDQNHYLIYPTTGQTASNQILINNYDENNFSIYRFKLSCMGNYIESFDITWDDLTEANGYPDWESFGQNYATWNNISYNLDDPIALGGGQEGEIWRLNVNEGEDNPLRIWNITEVSQGPLLIEVTTDRHNYVVGDDVYFSGILGSTELTGKKGIITSVPDQNTIRVQFSNSNPLTITAYTSGGLVSRVIPFEFTSKNFNPFIQQGEKLRCGWIYIYVDTTESLHTDIDGNFLPGLLQVEIFTNDSTIPSQVLSVDLNYQSRISSFNDRPALKVWRKIFINQTARNIQFRFSNKQPGTNIRIHATEFGFMSGGRLI